MTGTSALARCLDDPGYTPPRAELASLIRGMAGLAADQARLVERCLARAGWPSAEIAIALLPEAAEELRMRLYSLLDRFATAEAEPMLFSALLAGLADDCERCQRVAASALGKLGDARAEPHLLARLGAASPELSRVIVEALGKVGGHASLAQLEALSPSDAELARRTTRARLLLSRRLRREEPSSLLLDRPLPARYRIAFECRRGLGEILMDELAALAPRQVSASSVEIEHAGSLRDLLVARTALHCGLVVPLSPDEKAPDARIAEALARPSTVAALAAWSEGPIRLRLDWQNSGHQRALSWAVAEQLARRAPVLLNDPRNPTFGVLADPSATGTLVLVPRLDPDPRFAYRKRDVPAASHPTIAAALARIAGVRPADVIWDPFVGSGLELVERARLGPYARLIGSDIDPRALSAARENLDSAGVSGVELACADALDFSPGSVSLVLTNPPMGRRVARDGSLATLLDRFVMRAGTLLSRGGRVVWLSVLDRRTESAARRAGFDVFSGPQLDLGGFSARVQVLSRR
jgi:predicted RNA methylase